MKLLVVVCAALSLGGASGIALAAEQTGNSEHVEMERIGVTEKRETLKVYSPETVAGSAEI